MVTEQGSAWERLRAVFRGQESETAKLTASNNELAVALERVAVAQKEAAAAGGMIPGGGGGVGGLGKGAGAEVKTAATTEAEAAAAMRVGEGGKLAGVASEGGAIAGEGGKVMGLVGKLGPALGGLAKFAGPIGLAIGGFQALNAFVSTHGNFGERVSSALHSLTFGLIGADPTRAAQRAQGTQRANTSYSHFSGAPGGILDTKGIDQYQKRVGQLRQQLELVSRGNFDPYTGVTQRDTKVMLDRQAQINQLTKQFTIEQNRALPAVNNLNRSLMGGSRWNNEANILKQITPNLDKLVGKWRDSGALSAIQYSRGLEQQGRVPRGSTDKLIKDLESKYPALGTYLQQQGARSMKLLGDQIRVNSVQKNSIDLVGSMKQTFGWLPSYAETAGKGTQGKLRTAMVELRKIVEHGTAAQRAAALPLLAKAREDYDKYMSALERRSHDARVQTEKDAKEMAGTWAKLTGQLQASLAPLTHLNPIALFGGQVPAHHRAGGFAHGVVPGDSRRDGTLALLSGKELIVTGHGQKLMEQRAPGLVGHVVANQLPHFAGGGMIGGGAGGQRGGPSTATPAANAIALVARTGMIGMLFGSEGATLISHRLASTADTLLKPTVAATGTTPATRMLGAGIAATNLGVRATAGPVPAAPAADVLTPLLTAAHLPGGAPHATTTSTAGAPKVSTAGGTPAVAGGGTSTAATQAIRQTQTQVQAQVKTIDQTYAKGVQQQLPNTTKTAMTQVSQQIQRSQVVPQTQTQTNQVVKLWKNMSSGVVATHDQLNKDVDRRMADQTISVTTHTANARDVATKHFGQMRDSLNSAMDAANKHVSTQTGAMSSTVGTNTQQASSTGRSHMSALEQSIYTAMDAGVNVTGSGMAKIAGDLNSGLKGLSVKGIPLPSLAKGIGGNPAKFNFGGYVPGDPRQDGTLILAAGDEFVMTGHGQNMMERYAPGLLDHISTSQLPHFAKGGPVGGGKGRVVTASDFGGPNDPSAYMHSTASGKTMDGSLVGYAELSTPPGSLNFSALGHLPMGTMLPVTYNGKTITIPKVDVGAGGPGLNGHVRAIDLTQPAANQLGFPGMADVIVGNPAGISLAAGSSGAGATWMNVKTPGVKGKGAVADAAKAALKRYADAANKYGQAHMPQPTAGGGSAGPAPMQGPAAVQAMIRKADEITSHHYPYLWGGGHDPGFSPPYDCSGSVSSVLHAAGLLGSPDDSTAFESYGAAGPGKSVSIYGNPSHVFMSINGHMFSTSGSNPGGGAGWMAPHDTSGFVARHPPGLAKGGYVMDALLGVPKKKQGEVTQKMAAGHGVLPGLRGGGFIPRFQDGGGLTTMVDSLGWSVGSGRSSHSRAHHPRAHHPRASRSQEYITPGSSPPSLEWVTSAEHRQQELMYRLHHTVSKTHHLPADQKPSKRFNSVTGKIETHTVGWWKNLHLQQQQARWQKAHATTIVPSGRGLMAWAGNKGIAADPGGAFDLGYMDALDATQSGVISPDAALAAAIAAATTKTVHPKATAVAGGAGAPAGDRPAQVHTAMMSAANRIIGKPYGHDGGHGSWEASNYDCSGAAGYVLHAAGLQSGFGWTGTDQSWGLPGPGKYITRGLRNPSSQGNGHEMLKFFGHFLESGGGGPLGQPRVHWDSGWDNPFPVQRHPPGLRRGGSIPRFRAGGAVALNRLGHPANQNEALRRSVPKFGIGGFTARAGMGTGGSHHAASHRAAPVTTHRPPALHLSHGHTPRTRKGARPRAPLFRPITHAGHAVAAPPPDWSTDPTAGWHELSLQDILGEIPVAADQGITDAVLASAKSALTKLHGWHPKGKAAGRAIAGIDRTLGSLDRESEGQLDKTQKAITKQLSSMLVAHHKKVREGHGKHAKIVERITYTQRPHLSAQQRRTEAALRQARDVVSQQQSVERPLERGLGAIGKGVSNAKIATGFQQLQKALTNTSVMSYDHLTRLAGQIGKEAGRARGLKQQRLKQALALVDFQMGQRTGALVAIAQNETTGIEASRTRLTRMLDRRGIDQSSEAGAKAIAAFDQQARSVMQDTVNKLKRAYRMAQRAHDTKGMADIGAKLSAALENLDQAVTDTIDAQRAAVQAHVQAVEQQAQSAVDSATHATTLASTREQALQLRQQIDGTYGTLPGAQQTAGYITSNIVPALQGELAAMTKQQQAAQSVGDTALATQIAEAIAGKQNDILQAQLDAQNAIKDATAATAQNTADLQGSTGFAFQGQEFTDAIAAGVGA